jgi:hypothetical protein
MQAAMRKIKYLLFFVLLLASCKGEDFNASIRYYTNNNSFVYTTVFKSENYSMVFFYSNGYAHPITNTLTYPTNEKSLHTTWFKSSSSNFTIRQFDSSFIDIYLPNMTNEIQPYIIWLTKKIEYKYIITNDFPF